MSKYYKKTKKERLDQFDSFHFSTFRQSVDTVVFITDTFVFSSITNGDNRVRRSLRRNPWCSRKSFSSSIIGSSLLTFQNPGRLKLTSNSIVFKNLRTGKLETLTKDEIESVKWMKRSRGYGLKFITKNDTSLRYDGFKDTVRDVLLSTNDIY